MLVIGLNDQGLKLELREKIIWKLKCWWEIAWFHFSSQGQRKFEFSMLKQVDKLPHFEIEANS